VKKLGNGFNLLLLAILAIGTTTHAQVQPGGGGSTSTMFVDKTHYATVESALAALPPTGGIIVDTLVEAFTSNPFSKVTTPVWVQFGQGTWTTTVPIILGGNQWLTGMGPQSTVFQAVGAFPAGSGVIQLGHGGETHSSFVRDLGILCTGIKGCTGLVFDGAQNPAGASNVSIKNYSADGVRLQQTSAATSAVSLRDFWAYSSSTSSPTGSGLNVQAFSGTLVVENFTQASTHGFPGPSAFKVAGGVGEVTFINCAGEGITDQFLLTGTSATTVIIAAGQQASSTPGVNTVHVGAGVSNYTLINVNQGSSTGAALVDDTRSYTFKGGIAFLSVAGGATKYDYGSVSQLGWIRTPATTVQKADLIQLQSGFVGTQAAYDVLDSSGHTQFSTLNDGRIGFRGGQTGAFVQTATSDPLTANRVPQFPNGTSATVMVVNFRTAGATTSDVLAVQGMTASGHCALSASNSLAANGQAAGTTWLDTPGANAITLHHTNTNGQIFTIECTSN
jgi:hypothetical protein